jgi:hypothetical protein
MQSFSQLELRKLGVTIENFTGGFLAFFKFCGKSESLPAGGRTCDSENPARRQLSCRLFNPSVLIHVHPW